MNSDVVFWSRWRRALWVVVGGTAAGALLSALGLALGGPVPLAVLGALSLVLGLLALRSAVAEVRADARGIQVRTLLGRRSTPWRDVADLRIQLRTMPRGGDARRLILVRRDGHQRLLPFPAAWDTYVHEFAADLDTLRALHRRHGSPELDHLVVVSRRTAGRRRFWPLVACLLLLAGASLAAWFVPRADAHVQEWRAAVPCTASTPAEDRSECLTTLPAVIERIDDNGPKRGGSLYFTDDRPLDRLYVSQEAAQAFEAGDKVELTVWQGQVMEVAGSRHMWHRNVVVPGELTVMAALLTLAAGYPAALLLMRRRGRRLADDEVLPSALPFAAVLVGTGAWLLPLCYRHPTSLVTSRTALLWAAAGTAATLAMAAWAWRATRIRPRQDLTSPEAEEGEVFLRAHFLESTDYNPHGFGTHIALGGDEPPAVTPGPDRFAARTIPARRLTVGEVRRARGSDGDTVPRTWHIAELDDAGTPVRLAAAPADLTRVLRALEAVGTLKGASTSGSDR